MSQSGFRVKYLTSKDCFVYISSACRFFATGSTIKLMYNGDHLGYFSVKSSNAVSEEFDIGISSLYAKRLGIKENTSVLASEVQIPSIKRVKIIPASKSDYEILEGFSDVVQNILLKQIKVLYTGQYFVVWIGNNLHVTVYVGDIIPVSPGAIGFLTEVDIDPDCSSIIHLYEAYKQWRKLSKYHLTCLSSKKC
nr:unnamed protein product [Callosobruchus analis]